MAENVKDMIGSFGSDIGNISASNNDKLDKIDEKIDKIIEMLEPLVDTKEDFKEPTKVEDNKENTKVEETTSLENEKKFEEILEDAVRKLNEEKTFTKVNVDSIIEQPTEESKEEPKEEKTFVDISTLLGEESNQKVEETPNVEPIVPAEENIVVEPKPSYSIVKDNYVGLTMQEVKTEGGKQGVIHTANNSVLQQLANTKSEELTKVNTLAMNAGNIMNNQ